VQRDSDKGDGYKYDLTQQIVEYHQNGMVNLSAGTVTNPDSDNNMVFDGCGNRTKLNGATSAFNEMNQPKDPGFDHDADGNLKSWEEKGSDLHI